MASQTPAVLPRFHWVDQRSLSRPYTWCVIAAGSLICVYSVYRLAQDPRVLDWRLLLLVATTITTSRFLSIKIPNANGEILVSDAFVFLTMLVYGGYAAVLLATAESMQTAARFKWKRITIMMAGATSGCSTFLTFGTVTLWFGAPNELALTALPATFVGAVCVMGLVQYIANTGLGTLTVALRENLPIWHTWSRYYLWTSIIYFAGAVAAGVTVKLIMAFGFRGAIVIAPIVTSIYFTYRMYLKNVEVSVQQAVQAERHVAELSGYIAELKKADQAVQKSERDYRGLFENAHDAIIILTPGDETVLEVNPSACRLYGLSRDEFIGLSMQTLSKDISRGKSFIQQMLDQGSNLQFESVQHSRDGSELLLEINATPIDYNDQRAILTINRDITEARKLEEQLRQSQKMESIGTLAGGIAHDFNNLMTAVTGYSTMLLEDLDADSPMREDLEEIKMAAGRAATLTRQLLAFSRKQMLQPRVLNLNRVVDDISGLIGRLIGDHITITKDLDRTAWPIEVDPSQIEQVLLNLAVNARDAMLSGGTLRITTGNVQLTDPSCQSLGLAAGDYVLLTVSDDGCGMDAETKAHIFEPFFSTKPVGKGTGLGLSTVHGIIKQSGGEIEVLSTPGDGTQFKIFLPRVGSEDEEQ